MLPQCKTHCEETSPPPPPPPPPPNPPLHCLTFPRKEQTNKLLFLLSNRKYSNHSLPGFSFFTTLPPKPKAHFHFLFHLHTTNFLQQLTFLFLLFPTDPTFSLLLPNLFLFTTHAASLPLTNCPCSCSYLQQTQPLQYFFLPFLFLFTRGATSFPQIENTQVTDYNLLRNKHLLPHTKYQHQRYNYAIVNTLYYK